MAYLSQAVMPCIMQYPVGKYSALYWDDASDRYKYLQVVQKAVNVIREHGGWREEDVLGRRLARIQDLPNTPAPNLRVLRRRRRWELRFLRILQKYMTHIAFRPFQGEGNGSILGNFHQDWVQRINHAIVGVKNHFQSSREIWARVRFAWLMQALLRGVADLSYEVSTYLVLEY